MSWKEQFNINISQVFQDVASGALGYSEAKQAVTKYTELVLEKLIDEIPGDLDVADGTSNYLVKFKQRLRDKWL